MLCSTGFPGIAKVYDARTKSASVSSRADGLVGLDHHHAATDVAQLRIIERHELTRRLKIVVGPG